MGNSDIIVAVATAEGRGGIGVVRLSGFGLGPMLRELVNVPLTARRATLADFVGSDGQVIDRGIAVYYPAPHSYTGEEILELQGHGSPIALRMLLKRCLELGARVAEPGEFTKRAFLNEKLDLAQAEAVADLVDASTERAARSALHSLQGAFSQQINASVRGLVDLRVLIESSLDFPEEDLETATSAEVASRLSRLSRDVQAILESSRKGTILREGVRVVLAGAPNVGKSSLLNRLAGEDLAIVTAIPGTTRDAIRASVDIGGVPMHFIDTAGLRASEDPVERIGIDRAREALARADVAVLISDVTTADRWVGDEVIEQIAPAAGCVRVLNKIDLVGLEPGVVRGNDGPTVRLSALTGSGIESLHEAILELIGWGGDDEGIFMARARHIHALERAQLRLEEARQPGKPVEFVAEDLRLAQEALAEITGSFSSEALLGEIFSRFCIGK